MSTDNHEKPSSPPALPSKLPEPTGNVFVDVSQKMLHILDVPCSRDAFLSGIAGGVGIGFIRGMSSKPPVAINWAIGSFLVLSATSWHICQKKFADERKQVEQIMEASSRRQARDENSAVPPK